MVRRVPVIGVVGGVGSGKSSVAAQLARAGGIVIAGDKLGHEALRQPDIKKRVQERWGSRVLDDAGEIDRKQLGSIVFADGQERKALEAMTHPYIAQRIREEIENALKRPDTHLIVLDAALMLEAGWHGVCDHLVFVDSPREVRLQRLKERCGWKARDVDSRESAQMPLTDKKRHADAVVDNSAGLDRLAPQIDRLLIRWGLVGNPAK
jgi:dephospho-CoA kinase